MDYYDATQATQVIGADIARMATRLPLHFTDHTLMAEFVRAGALLLADVYRNAADETLSAVDQLDSRLEAAPEVDETPFIGGRWSQIEASAVTFPNRSDLFTAMAAAAEAEAAGEVGALGRFGLEHLRAEPEAA